MRDEHAVPRARCIAAFLELPTDPPPSALAESGESEGWWSKPSAPLLMAWGVGILFVFFMLCRLYFLD